MKKKYLNVQITETSIFALSGFLFGNRLLSVGLSISQININLLFSAKDHCVQNS